jgi:hypothetical protein
MEYTYEIIDECKIIKVTVLGILTTCETALMGIVVRVKAFETGYKLLFDYRLLTSIQISSGAAYFWFPDYYDKINIKLRHIPTAIIINKTNYSAFNFFENTCYNKGIKLKVFEENEKALEWLNQI